MPIHLHEGALQVAGKDEKSAAIFHALPGDMKNPPPTMILLYEWVSKTDKTKRIWSTAAINPGFERTEKPLCFVWKNPFQVPLPRD